MTFKITAIINKNTSAIQITEEIEANDTEEALLLFKKRYTENLTEIISLDMHTRPSQNKAQDQFVPQDWQDLIPNTSSIQQNPGGHAGSHAGTPG